MAADGAWPHGSNAANDVDAQAAAGVRATLQGVEARLEAPDRPTLRPESAAALASALEALALRMARQETEAGARSERLTAELRRLAERVRVRAESEADLAERLAAGEARISARFDAALGALEAAHAERVQARAARIWSRWLLAGAGAAAALSLAGAVVTVAAMTRLPQAPPADDAAAERPSQSPAGGLRLRLSPEAAAPFTASARGVTVSLPAGVAPQPAARPREAYSAVAAALDRGDAHALARLAGLAQAGDVRAQLHLASLYETGASGVSRDLKAAQAWTRRAAEGGDRVGMHNLALFLADAGRDAEAAAWFRRAAERGVVDAQYNLGLLYGAGRGVERNLREAYRWFAVAANAGDAEARAKQVELEAYLKPGERGGVDRETEAFRPAAASAVEPVQLIPPAETLAETQALLARKGYYVGPVDGVATDAVRTAVTAYLRDHPHMTAETAGGGGL